VKIALLSFNFGQYCIRLANGLARHGQVLLLLPRAISEPYRFALDVGVELFQFDEPRLREPYRQLPMAVRILRRLNAFQPDVIHYQAGHLWFNLVWPLYGRFPVVVTIHESRHHFGDRDSLKTPQWVMDLGYRRADRVIVHGEQIRRAVVADLGIPRERIDVVPTVRDLVIDPSQSWDVEEDGRLVLFFGRIWPYKGLDVLIRAEPLITKRLPDVRILIAGRGEDFDQYRRLMAHPEKFDVRNDYIADSEVPSIFMRAAVVVLPYVDGSVSGVAPVAFTFGKPVVATSVGILPEMVEHERTGLVVPPRDEKALAEAIASLLEDEGRRHQLGRNAQVTARTVFDPISVAAKTIRTYERAIVSRRAARGRG
jgi:glycosyltransferase involved in cell wall biosynthesis